ncbi:MAG TPA: HAD family hydrolase [Burkholderiales bacterium]|nr:HAD family hydrolase [Burkholderiales bacterium]
MKLALFDLDNTLLAGDSDYEWARFLVSRGIVDGPSYEARNDYFYTEYKAGTLDIAAFLEFQLAPLAQHSMRQLQDWHAEFMRESVLPMITPAARQLVSRHSGAGDLCAVITATNAFVTAPIARELGVPHLIATQPEVVDGRYTGRWVGTPCFQHGKIVCLELWLDSRGQRWADFEQTWFYSDSRNDLPLLERVSAPVAVDPDDTLRATAAERGWPVISLRGPGR